MTTEPTNTDRARWAQTALDAFAAATGTADEDLATQVGDLLADLRHLCDAHRVSFHDCLAHGDAHYHDETATDTTPGPACRHTPPGDTDELYLIAVEYQQLLNARPLTDADRLIADACVDPLWDERTNLLSLLAKKPADLGLVLATNADTYVVIRHVDRAWVVDRDPVDWQRLEDRAFDPAP